MKFLSNKQKTHIFDIGSSNRKTLCNTDLTNTYDYWYISTVCDYLTKKEHIIKAHHYYMLDTIPRCEKCFNHPRLQLELLKYTNEKS